MNMKTVIAALVAVVVFGIFVWLLIAEKGRTSDLTAQLDSAKKTAESEIARLTSQADSRQRDLDSLTERNKALEKDIAAAAGRVKQLETSVQAAERQASEARSEAEALRNEYGSFKTESDSLKAEAEQFKAEVERLKAEVERLKAAETEAQNRITTLSAIAQNINKISGATQAALECPPCAVAEPVECPAIPAGDSLSADRLREEAARSRAEAQSVREANEKISAELKNLINSQEVAISQLKDQLSMTFMDTIFFAPGSVTLTSDGARVLDTVSAALKSLGDKKVVVIGHTDDLPTGQRKFPSNWELSTARASAVIRYFQKKGDLIPENLEAVGRAFYDPVAPNDTAENRQKNRRVEIVVSNRLVDEAVAGNPAAEGTLASNS